MTGESKLKKKKNSNLTGESFGCVGDRVAVEPPGPRDVHREVGGHRRHLPLHAQLQRRAADLRGLRQQLPVPAEENLGEGPQTGNASLTAARCSPLGYTAHISPLCIISPCPC